MRNKSTAKLPFGGSHLRLAKVFLLMIVLLNVFILYYTWKADTLKNLKTVLTRDLAFDNDFLYGNGRMPNPNQIDPKERIKNSFRHIRKSITIVFRSYYTFENDLQQSIESILNVLPMQPIVVIQDGHPYPPLMYEKNYTSNDESSVQFISLGFNIEKSLEAQNPLSTIKTKYTLFMPDSVRINSKNLLQKILKEINNLSSEKIKKIGDKKLKIPDKDTKVDEISSSSLTINDGKRFLIVPFSSNNKAFCSCMSLNLDLPNWTIDYTATNNSDKCDIKHAIFIETEELKKMPDPLAKPFPEMFYIQAKLANLSKTIYPQAFPDGRNLFTSYHNKQKRSEMRRKEFREMYKTLQVKKIVRHLHKFNKKTETKEGKKSVSSSSSTSHNLVLDHHLSSSNLSLPLVTEVDLIGCERNTKSCIGSVYNYKPFFIYLGKHTPPCCLEKIKATFHHVLEELENVGIRYWLDNYSLRSALQNQQLSPDAFDIDISFNVKDLERSNSLKKAQNKPFTDNEGFYWLKATDGHYFFVRYSKINQNGVNLLPYEVDGTTAKPDGFFGWKAKSFSAERLHPMSTVLFLGKNVMCPNNVQEYLEAKQL